MITSQSTRTESASDRAEAYRPQGSILNAGVRPPATGDYKAWTPGG